MAFERFEDIEGAALLGLAAVFVAWEWLLPGRRVDRRVDLRRDLLALMALMVAVNLSRGGLHRSFRWLDLESTFATAAWNRWPAGVRMAAGFVLSDFCLYWLHRTMHLRAFWNMHKWHHSIREMWWFSGLRTSLTHAFLYAVPQVFIGFYLFHLTVLQQGLMFGLGIFVQYFSHANIRVSLGPLEWFLITPRYHRLHHASSGVLQHGNYGTVFSIWDRLFGTYVDPRSQPADYPLGLEEPARTARMIVGV